MQLHFDVLDEVRVSGEMLCLGVDGKQIKGSKRQRQGEKARRLLSYFVHETGMTLKQRATNGTEGKTARQLLCSLEGLETLPWLFTGDAAFAERPLVETILDKRGVYLFDLKDNLPDVKAYAEWAFNLPTCEQDSVFEDSEVRSGELWLRLNSTHGGGDRRVFNRAYHAVTVVIQDDPMLPAVEDSFGR